MVKLENKQLKQCQNIVDTLVEANEHLNQLIKNKELNQSIFMFSSIVEGFESIRVFDISSHLKNWNNQIQKTENYLIMIAQELENNNFLKINQILQFSLIPLLKQIQQSLNMYQDEDNKIYSIGVFHSFANPREFYPNPRIDAMVQESKKQHTQLLFFTSDDVDLEAKTVEAELFEDNQWQRKTLPYPDVINNVGVGKKSRIERKLRREIPFTSFHVGNKFSLPRRMVQYRKYIELLVPFKMCNNKEIIQRFLEDNPKVVFKALQSNRGENIFFVTKKGNRYVLTEHKKERIMSQDVFNQWIDDIILREKNSFIVQRYIHTRTKNDEPYHFRAHVQKDGDGKWVLTHIYPRVGNKKSNLSNVAEDGRVDDFHEFMMREFDENGAKHESNILELSLELAHHLDKLYGLNLNELGIDLAIDETGRYWMHEANNGPQTAYHEEKRAVNTIAYAKYIAQNGIFHQESRFMDSHQFNANSTTIEKANLQDCVKLGVLLGEVINDDLMTSCIEAAQKENMQLFAFTPYDIDFDEMLIRGHFYENAQWVKKVVPYPDIIFDRLKARNNQHLQIIYDELEDIPLINPWSFETATRSLLLQTLQANDTISQILVDFEKVSRSRDIFRFIEKYKNIMLLPDASSNKDDMVSIQKQANGSYDVIRKLNKKAFNESQLLNHVKDMLKEKSYVVQADDFQSFSINVHLMKTNQNDWGLVHTFVSNYLDGNKTKLKRENISLEAFFTKHPSFGDAKEYKDKCEHLSSVIMHDLSSIYPDDLSELILKFKINQDNNLVLFEVNPDGPEIIYNSQTLAKAIVQYAISLTN
ncbi:MAG TPA: YheC/YheD family protein [Candidatus Avamphibacillus intestinigallinarum]|nr:YheC/YheD family protein [Candidatus Avamphibacillus intestinigallinarum]